MQRIKARDNFVTSVMKLREKFSNLILENEICDAIYCNSGFENVIGVCGLSVYAPVLLELFKEEKIAHYLVKLIEEKNSVLIKLDNNLSVYVYLNKNGEILSANLESDVKKKIAKVVKKTKEFAGEINTEGEHIFNLKTISPGPHFFVNLLIGNRIEFDYPLQTTPKSVVDGLGRGSFRSHADFQVLATRWDLRQEENGFPANRQFYLVEDGKKIFYSGNVNDPNFKSGYCVHSQNITTIVVNTKCGLEIIRKIFLLPQYKGLPLATEVQRIEVYNKTDRKRRIKIVTIGMFGSSAPHAQMEDVLYSNIIMQSSILKDKDNILAIGDDYYPLYCKNEKRFHTILIRTENGVDFAKEFCSNYNEFVGNGTLEDPEGLLFLTNKLNRKGPGFFALGGYFIVKENERAIIDTFTGVVSERANPEYSENSYVKEIKALIDKFKEKDSIEKALNENREFYKNYSSFFNVQSSEKDFNIYFNKNLPFQIFYQTFVSRSFCQTQKGYREIGFREIQDLYASMYYFVAMGKKELVKKLLKEWASKVFELGYAYHNFFWVGKEPGRWSDDGLWLVQAVYRYINLTGDVAFLMEETGVADKEIKRPIYKTIEAIIHYSAYISTGKHGLPLLDRADWNDCLRIDRNTLDGIEKEKLYFKRIEELKDKNICFNDKNDFSESVMNACLLKLAIDEYAELSELMKNYETSEAMKKLSKDVYDKIQKYAWKEDFFARVLLNRFPDGPHYIGAKGDNLGLEPNLKDSYFINSYSWPILADVATEAQIEKMTETLERALKTKFGFKLMTLSALNKIEKNVATGEYFPGDRENCAVFKHASMMMAYSMLKAAKIVNDRKLAEHLTELAYWMIDIVLPYKTMKNPYITAGNPRFCTQYINSETGEHIGPLLSGTATWLNLCLIFAFGIDLKMMKIYFDPILKLDEKEVFFKLNLGNTTYRFRIEKPIGFYRIKDNKYDLILDGTIIEGNILPVFQDGKEHNVWLKFY